MSSGRTSWFRRLLHRFTPFLFRRCPAGNWHWRWENFCWCRVNEHDGNHKGGVLNLRTGEEVTLAAFSPCPHCHAAWPFNHDYNCRVTQQRLFFSNHHPGNNEHN